MTSKTRGPRTGYEVREYDRVHALFGIGLLGAFLLLAWGVSILFGAGLGYYWPTRFGLRWTAHDLWQFAKAVTLILIALGVARSAVEQIELYHDVRFLHDEIDRLQGRKREP
jgi:hypothetical protein